MDTETVIRAVMQAYSTGDIGGTLALMSPEVCYRTVATAGVAPYCFDCRGLEAFQGALSSIGATVEITRYEMFDLIVDGTRGASRQHTEFVHRTTGKVVKTTSALFWTVQDGKVTELVEHYDTAIHVWAASTDAE